ncbi:MAG: amidohydrolase family protein [Burkholderiales bacterium]
MFTRRKFIGTTIGAGVALATGACATQPAGKRMVVDAGAHLWKASSPDYPWNPGAKPQLPEPFTIERALPMMDEAGVDRVVVVPPGLNDNNSYALEAARRYPGRFAVMGRIPLQDPKSAVLLPRWKQDKGMLGVRVTFFGKAAAWLDDGTADWFWPAAEKADLPVMFAAFGMVSKFEPIAARHPGLTLIIDHMGMNTAIAKEGRTAEVIGQAVALAKYPNVSIKMSNLVGSSLEPYPFSDLTPHLRRVFDAFGPQRCYWGTDLTAGFERATWRQRITHLTEELKFLSERDKDWVMGRGILERLKWA